MISLTDYIHESKEDWVQITSFVLQMNISSWSQWDGASGGEYIIDHYEKGLSIEMSTDLKRIQVNTKFA